MSSTENGSIFPSSIPHSVNSASPNPPPESQNLSEHTQTAHPITRTSRIEWTRKTPSPKTSKIIPTSPVDCAFRPRRGAYQSVQSGGEAEGNEQFTLDTTTAFAPESLLVRKILLDYMVDNKKRSFLNEEDKETSHTVVFTS